MKPKAKIYKNGASVTMEKTSPSGYYIVRLYYAGDQLRDRIMVDDYRSALDYYRCFCLTAKNN